MQVATTLQAQRAASTSPGQRPGISKQTITPALNGPFNTPRQKLHLFQCLDNQRMLLAMSSERVILSARKFLIASYKKETGETVRLTADDVREQLKELTRPSEL